MHSPELIFAVTLVLNLQGSGCHFTLSLGDPRGPLDPPGPTFPPVILHRSLSGEHATRELPILVLVSLVADEEPVIPFFPGSLLSMTMTMMTTILPH